MAGGAGRHAVAVRTDSVSDDGVIWPSRRVDPPGHARLRHEPSSSRVANEVTVTGRSGGTVRARRAGALPRRAAVGAGVTTPVWRRPYDAHCDGVVGTWRPPARSDGCELVSLYVRKSDFDHVGRVGSASRSVAPCRRRPLRAGLRWQTSGGTAAVRPDASTAWPGGNPDVIRSRRRPDPVLFNRYVATLTFTDRRVPRGGKCHRGTVSGPAGWYQVSDSRAAGRDGLRWGRGSSTPGGVMNLFPGRCVGVDLELDLEFQRGHVEAASAGRTRSRGRTPRNRVG